MRYVFISRKNTRLRTKNNNNSFAFYQQAIIQRDFFRSDRHKTCFEKACVSVFFCIFAPALRNRCRGRVRPVMLRFVRVINI